MLRNPVQVRVEGEIDFDQAKELADSEARKKSADPMLLSWYAGKTGQFAPNVPYCGGDKPGWLVYAESRGGDICIDINEEEYVFVYRSSW